MSPPPEYPFRHQWHTANGISVIGHAWSGEDLLRDNGLCSLFKDVVDEDGFRKTLQSLNGYFAVILEHPEFKAAAVDHIRAFPVVYRLSAADFEVLSDHRWKPGYEFDTEAVAFFKEGWCTQGNTTLVRGSRQLSAGQYLWHQRGSKKKPVNYHRHHQTKRAGESRTELFARAVDAFEASFARAIAKLNGRTAVVPLSGGYDSRWILAMLVRSGYPKILAYTYGDPSGHEARIAGQVASQLQVDWHFIEYEASVFKGFFSEAWSSYSRANHFFTSLPHEQDFFALQKLKEQQLLPDDFVALPGFCGDVLGGSVTAFRPAEWTLSGLEDMIASKHLGGQPGLVQLNYEGEVLDEASFYDAYQDWYVTNKESKFIVNAVRVYEHFGGDWDMPFWDRELSEFWYSVPYGHRKKQNLYNEVLFTHYFEPMGIGIQKPSSDDNYPNVLKERIKEMLPRQVSSILKGLKPGSGPNRLDILEKQIRDQLVEEIRPDSGINGVHAQYFLENLNK